MQKTSILAFGAALASTITPAFSALAIGDLAVVGLNSTDSSNIDEFAIVALADIAANEQIKLTDRGWKSGFFDSNNTTEGTLLWQPSAVVPAGSIFRVSVDLDLGVVSGLPGSLTIQSGFTSGTSGIFTGGGDQVLIYQGTEVSPTFVYGFSSQATTASSSTITGEWMGASGTLSATTSMLPPLLTNGFSAAALTVGNHADNLVYTGATSGTRDALLTAISTPGSWSGSNDTTFDLAAGGTQFPSSFSIVPEPSTAFLLLLGSLGLLNRRR